MNLFFSPPVRTYSLVLQHHQAPTVVDALVSTGFVEFEMSPYDDSNDPFYIIYSRVRQLKFKISGLLSSIEEKYGEKVRSLNSAERQLTIGRMKDYIEEKQIDYIRYLDMEETIITEKIAKFATMSANYDNLVSSIAQLDEELDLVDVKLEVVVGSFNSSEFVMLTGTCPRRDRYIIERLIFRKTHGHSYIVFKDREHSSGRDMFVCFVNRGVYKNISNKINNIFTLNKGVLYELPNMTEHLTNYKQKLTAKKEEYLHLLEISSEQFSRALKDYIAVPESSLQYHMARMAFLERIIYIICHSKPVGSPAKHHLFTIHVPEH